MSRNPTDIPPRETGTSTNDSGRSLRVAIADVSKRFGEHTVLSHINLEVPRGQFCVLLGPSGCGKSTLLRIVAGLETPSEGRVFIDGRDVSGISPGERNVAMVFQNYAIYPHMTVFDNIAFPLKLRKLSKDEITARVLEAARMLQLEDVLRRKPSQLSGGQRQRVAMGRAVVRDPSVFLFDEPLSNLDARLRVSMRMEIAQMHRNLGATTVYVTHDQVEAMTLADRIVVMDHGIVRQIDSPQGLYNHPADVMVAEFIGSPAMNLIEGELIRQDPAQDRVFRSHSLNIGLPPGTHYGRVFLGIRPEHVTVGETGALRGCVEFIEDTGSDKYAHVVLEGGQKLVVRAAPHTEISIGAAIFLDVDLQRVHVFPRE